MSVFATNILGDGPHSAAIQIGLILNTELYDYPVYYYSVHIATHIIIIATNNHFYLTDAVLGPLDEGVVHNQPNS